MSIIPRGSHDSAILAATAALAGVAITGAGGYVYLAAIGRTIPEALVAIVSAAVGSLAALTSVVLVVRADRPDDQGGGK